MKIVFMGTADFGIPALQALNESKHKIKAVISTPPRKKGRGLKLVPSPIELFAREHILSPIRQFDSLNTDEIKEYLYECQADAFIVVAFRILPREIFEIPTLGTFNIHASLLPRYRGAAPIQRAIEKGESETGITIFRINDGIDTGNIVLQEKCKIEECDTTPSLYQKLSLYSANLIVKACNIIEQGEVVYHSQDESIACKAPKLRKEEMWIDWSLSSIDICNKIKAFKPFPGVCCYISEKQINIEHAISINENMNGKIGQIVSIHKDYIDVQCGEGILRIHEVKPAGRKSMLMNAFLNGTTLRKGIVLR